MGRNLIETFDDFELDHRCFQLRRRGSPIRIERRVFELIAYLVRERDRVVSKEEIFARVWDGRSVTEGSLTVAMTAARKALGDDARAQRMIETHPRRGYRFIGEVREQSIWPHRVGDSARARSESVRDPFVGREAELRIVADSFRAAGAGRGSLVLLGGEAGIGKSSVLVQSGHELERAGSSSAQGHVQRRGRWRRLPAMGACAEGVLAAATAI